MKDRYADGVVSKSAVEVRSSVATQLKDTRLQLNMTQQTLAERAGTQKSNISRMESGMYNPSLDFLVKIADCMGKKLDIKLD